MHSPDRIVLDPAEVFDYVAVLIPSRHQICGYELHTDCLNQLTRIDVEEFIRRVLMEADATVEVRRVRSLVIGNKRLFGIWGYPAEVSATLKFSMKVSGTSVDRVCLFIIGACWAS
jgi:hypothetical protein